MSPKITPPGREPLITVYAQKEPKELPVDVRVAEKNARRAAALVEGTADTDPYAYQHEQPQRYDPHAERFVEMPLPRGAQVPSYWYDLLLEYESNQRAQATLGSPSKRGGFDQGDPVPPS